MICRLFTYLTDYLFGNQNQQKEVPVIPKDNMMNEASRLTNFSDMHSITWNVPEIRKRINDLSQEIKLLKKEIRTPHHQVTWAEQCELGALKHRVTVYAALQAFRRNKLHFQHMSPADQLDWLESHLDLDDRRELAIVTMETPAS